MPADEVLKAGQAQNQARGAIQTCKRGQCGMPFA